MDRNLFFFLLKCYDRSCQVDRNQIVPLRKWLSCFILIGTIFLPKKKVHIKKMEVGIVKFLHDRNAIEGVNLIISSFYTFRHLLLRMHLIEICWSKVSSLMQFLY